MSEFAEDRHYIDLGLLDRETLEGLVYSMGEKLSNMQAVSSQQNIDEDAVEEMLHCAKHLPLREFTNICGLVSDCFKKKIMAIKHLREYCGLDLKTAKEVVENWRFVDVEAIAENFTKFKKT